MNSLKKYMALMQEHPDWFQNKGEVGEIKIITDKKRILTEQRNIRAKLKKEGKPACWIDIGVLAEDPWFYILRDMVEFPDGKVWGYNRWIGRKSEEGGAFNVVLMCMQNERVLMIRKYRHEVRNWVWEFPSGFGEQGLSAEESAHNELREIGLIPSHLTLLTQIVEGRGGTSVFYVAIDTDQKYMLNRDEGIDDYRWASIAELEQVIRNGILGDGFSLWAYSLAKMKNIFW